MLVAIRSGVALANCWAAQERHCLRAPNGNRIAFVGFRGAAPANLWFKIGTNLIALALMLVLGRKIAKRHTP